MSSVIDNNAINEQRTEHCVILCSKEYVKAYEDFFFLIETDIHRRKETHNNYCINATVQNWISNENFDSTKHLSVPS